MTINTETRTVVLSAAEMDVLTELQGRGETLDTTVMRVFSTGAKALGYRGVMNDRKKAERALGRAILAGAGVEVIAALKQQVLDTYATQR
jgi:hypothetical protein